MKKSVKINLAKTKAIDAGNHRVYLYRLSSVSIDRVTLEKHSVVPLNSFSDNGLVDSSSFTAELSDETKVGVVTQKIIPSLIAVVSKKVDDVIVDFEMKEKLIRSFDFEGVEII